MEHSITRNSRNSFTSTTSSNSTYFSPLLPSPTSAQDASFHPFQHLPSSRSSLSSLSSSRHTSPDYSTASMGPSHLQADAQASTSKPRRERQTRLQEHLRTVKGSRGISPAASAKKTDAPAPTFTSGRPRRKAATRVVMQEVGSDSEDEGDRYEAGEEDEEAFEEEVEEKPRQRRGRRAAPAKRSVSVEDSVPVARSTARKSPAKQPNKRQREISNLSIDVDTMNELEVQQRLQREKEELMARLAQHGCVAPLVFVCCHEHLLTNPSWPRSINPQADVLDRALRSIADSNQQLTVESFLAVLSSLDTKSSPIESKPVSLALAPLSLHVSPPTQQKAMSFNTLESPSTPTTADRPKFAFPSPPRNAFAGMPIALLPPPPSQPSLLPSQSLFRDASAPSHQHHPKPTPSRTNRLAAFAARSKSSPSIPTLGSKLPVPAPLASATSPSHSHTSASAAQGLVATSINGMGRVALSRRTLFGQPAPGQSTSLSSPVRSQQKSTPHSAIASSVDRHSASALPGLPRHAQKSRGGASTDRLSKLQSWLDNDDDEPAEKDSQNGGAASDAAAVIRAKMASKVDALPIPPTSLPELPSNLVTPKKEADEGARVRVAGKTIQTLRSSQKRHREEEEEVSEHQSPELEPQVPTTRSAAKGKHKASSKCLCGQSADEDLDAPRCVECGVPYHLGCLNVASAAQLPTSWACERCSDIDVASQVQQQQRTPPLSAKRVRIGTTSTPVLGQEPTFVTAAFSPAPRRNNDFSDCADIALAPSPMHSPIRPYKTLSTVAHPTSPHSSAKVLIPTTPRFGEASLVNPSDYSPHSPLAFRQRRARIASNGGAFSELLNGGWGETSAFDAATNVDYHPGTPSQHHAAPSWSDVTMTPSRALSSSVHATPGTAGSAHSAFFDSPFMSHGRRPSFSLSGGHLRTPSHSDFFSSLDSHSHHHLAQSAPPLSSRLFAHAEHDSPYGPSAALAPSPSYRPNSPLNPRRIPSGQSVPNHHRRMSSSFSFGFGLGNGSASAGTGGRLGGPWSPTPAHAMLPPTMLGGHERRPSSVGMKVTQSMPGLRGFDGQELDGPFSPPFFLQRDSELTALLFAPAELPF
ncbi:hypothetical protein JCM11641_006801 [Rhodosporidiobolus odoratus]